MMPPRIDVDRQAIAEVVAEFYQRVRDDATLGPVFAERVENWPEHEEKITRFWANALLFERSYSGNPMRAHMDAGNVRPAHFEGWLVLFDEVLKTHISSPQREQWSALVHRIGRGLSFGLTEFQKTPGDPPKF
ncbi:group III truncated hemoglobin [uncultured Tateyamaria sp.]|uniref:group III truncated hemoglobin n=1 Tax=uncultured Tateyamaria sp. TaxID=455651 RepID=UPI0026037B7C|nr:group III truncated hemoglobin [uncultured Tateyamaria sp.]